jgi:16S rRNA processing protein RimM
LTDDNSRNWILIGRTAGTFGVRGEVKVDPLTDFPERFESLSTVYVGAAHEKRSVESSRPHGRLIVLKLTGVDDMDAASGLRGCDLFVPRAAAIPLPEGHYLLDDLIGVQVETKDGARVGAIAEVLRTGSNDVYVIRSGRTDLLVPGIRDAVLDLDLGARRMIIDPWVLEPPD